MKRIAIAVMFVALVSVSCGGGGGGGDCTTAENAAIASFDSFGSLIESAEIQACIQLINTDCACPTSGNVTADLATGILTWTNCTGTDDSVFSGRMNVALDLTTASADMPTFAECTDVVATNIDLQGTCAGNITAKCGGQDVTCNLVNDPEGGCTLECTC